MIREARKEDHAALVALFCEENIYNNAIAPDRVAETRDVLRPAELEEFIKDATTQILVFESDGDIAGVVLSSLHHQRKMRWKADRAYVYIDDIVVGEVHRGQGIATLLIQAVVQWAGEVEAECVDLHVWKTNESAARLYRKIGFREKQYLMSYPIRS